MFQSKARVKQDRWKSASDRLRALDSWGPLKLTDIYSGGIVLSPSGRSFFRPGGRKLPLPGRLLGVSGKEALIQKEAGSVTVFDADEGMEIQTFDNEAMRRIEPDFAWSTERGAWWMASRLKIWKADQPAVIELQPEMADDWITATSGTLIGTRSGRVFRMENDGLSLECIAELGTPVLWLHQDPEERWIFAASEDRTFSARGYQERTVTAMKAHAGALFFAAEGAVWVTDGGGSERKAAGPFDIPVTAIGIDGKGRIIVGTFDGELLLASEARSSLCLSGVVLEISIRSDSCFVHTTERLYLIAEG